MEYKSTSAEAVGVDLSYAVEAARANLARFAKVRVAQADIFKLPFALVPQRHLEGSSLHPEGW